MLRKKDRVPGKRAVAALRLPDVTPEGRLDMSWTPPGGHEVISSPKPKRTPASAKKKTAHSRAAKSKAKQRTKRNRTSVAA